ncbi:hypothetical protein FKM82_015131 [Ascaphus truei]
MKQRECAMFGTLLGTAISTNYSCIYFLDVLRALFWQQREQWSPTRCPPGPMAPAKPFVSARDRSSADSCCVPVRTRRQAQLPHPRAGLARHWRPPPKFVVLVQFPPGLLLLR